MHLFFSIGWFIRIIRSPIPQNFHLVLHGEPCRLRGMRPCPLDLCSPLSLESDTALDGAVKTSGCRESEAWIWTWSQLWIEVTRDELVIHFRGEGLRSFMILFGSYWTPVIQPSPAGGRLSDPWWGSSWWDPVGCFSVKHTRCLLAVVSGGNCHSGWCGCGFCIKNRWKP